MNQENNDVIKQRLDTKKKEPAKSATQRRMRNAMASLVRSAADPVFKRRVCGLPEDIARHIPPNRLNHIGAILNGPVRAYMHNNMSRRDAWEKALKTFRIPKVKSFEDLIATPWGHYLVNGLGDESFDDESFEIVKHIASNIATISTEYMSRSEFGDAIISEVSVHKALERGDMPRRVVELILNNVDAREIKDRINRNVDGLGDDIRRHFPELKNVNDRFLAASAWPLIQKLCAKILNYPYRGG